MASTKFRNMFVAAAISIGAIGAVGVADVVTAPVAEASVSSTYWWGTQTWYSRSEVRQSADWYRVIDIAKLACNAFGNPSIVKGCKNVVGRYTGWVHGTFVDAKKNNQCVSMKMLWTGQVIGMERYNCNWG